MQKLFVMIMSVTLLIVSSVPMIAQAANCPPPAHAVAMAANHPDANDVHQQDVSVQHDHDLALGGDCQHDRIECGCGCHNSIDALPQLLAPHMASQSLQMAAQFSITVPLQPEMVWQASTVLVPLPPPQYLIIS